MAPIFGENHANIRIDGRSKGGGSRRGREANSKRGSQDLEKTHFCGANSFCRGVLVRIVVRISQSWLHPDCSYSPLPNACFTALN